MMKLLSKIQTLEAQKSLLSETVKQKELLESKIISSLQPKVGRTFENLNMERRKQKILSDARKKLIALAIEDKEEELRQLNQEFEQKKSEYTENNTDTRGFLEKLERLMNGLTHRLNANMNKKVNFHSGRHQTHTEFVKKKNMVKKKRKWTTSRKKKNRAKYRTKLKIRKQERIKTIVSKIREENTVVNLSNEVVPNAAYIYLAKGLGFVPAQKVNTQDLKYDTSEFIRKLSWKAYFKANPELETDSDPSGGIHRDIKISGYTHPSFNSPLL